MFVIGIDPGTYESAIVLYEAKHNRIQHHSKNKNEDIFDIINSLVLTHNIEPLVVGIETIVSAYARGPIGGEMFWTADWTGRFHQFIVDKHNVQIYRPTRKQITGHLCKGETKNDSGIIKVLTNMFGEKGTKKKQGATYGMANDEWQALAVAVTCYDLFCR